MPDSFPWVEEKVLTTYSVFVLALHLFTNIQVEHIKAVQKGSPEALLPQITACLAPKAPKAIPLPTNSAWVPLLSSSIPTLVLSSTS